MSRVSFRAKLGIYAAIVCSGIAIQSARAQLVTNDLYKDAEYTQSGGGSLALDGYFFSSRVFMTNPTDFDGGSLTYPGPGSPATYTPVTDATGTYLNYQTPYYASSADLDAAFPAGTYTSTATNSMTSASQTTSVASPAADSYPLTIPTLTTASSAALQTVNPAANTPVNFNSFTPDPASTSSYVFFYIFDSSNDEVYDQSFLPSSTTSVTIPSGTLTPSTDYTYRLVFSDRIDSTNPADGLADELGFEYGNDGTLITTAVPEPASLMLAALTGMALLRRRAKRLPQ